MEITAFTATELPADSIGLLNIEKNREQVTERMGDEGFMRILAVYVTSVFQDFESLLRTEIHLAEDDIGLVLDECTSSFTTRELEPGIYTFKNLSKLFLTFFNLNMNYLTTQSIMNLMTLP